MAAAGNVKHPATEESSFPLPEALTRRVIGYLSIYRLVIALLLVAGHFGLFTANLFTSFGEAFASGMLLMFLLYSAFELFMAMRRRTDARELARYASLADIVFLGLLLFALGGLDSGIGILMVFSCALAGMLLPLRIALFVGALAAMVMVGQALLEALFDLSPVYDSEFADLIRAGIYGATGMLACLLSHRLAYLTRDYRLIAEKQETQIASLQELNEIIIRNMSTGVLAVDHNRRIQMMNESAWFLLGSPKVRELLLTDISPRLERALRRWQSEPAAEQETMALEGSQAQVVPTFASLPQAGGSTGALILLNDESVISRRALALSANSLAKLSGSIAHEIRNPLAALTHAAQLLDESPSITLNDMRLTNIILDQSKRMNGIIENILQLSRQEKSRPEPVELNKFLKNLAGEFRSTQGAKSLDFELKIETGQTFVVFDKSQLHQCLWKLLDNTVHHASVKRPPRAELRMIKDLRAGYCVITVEDNGPGIPKPRLVDIFEPFFTTRKEGSGLGLYIARQLSEANQAELTVDSTPGVGTAFHVRIRLAQAGGATLLPRQAEPEAIEVPGQ